jgi:polyhydroxybutyrate depolymerase
MIKVLLRLAAGILGLLLLLIAAGAAAFLIANRTNGWLITSGQKRAYLLYVPKSYDPNKPTPLVISIHGFAEWPAHQAQISRWNDLADQQGFIVVYPAGSGFPLRWRARGDALPGQDASLDVQFISDLIDKLEGAYNIDPARIYANGLSNGGGMSFVLSCRLSGRIAAVGMVAGAFVYPSEQCLPTRPVPAILFHGTADPIVPYQGGPSRSFELPFPAIPDWAAELARRNGCADAPQEIAPSGAVSGLRWTGCKADVVFYTVAGGGHSWPGGKPLPEFITGPTSPDIDATRVMWEFFSSHPLEGE